jgi:hypothetical protein
VGTTGTAATKDHRDNPVHRDKLFGQRHQRVIVHSG